MVKMVKKILLLGSGYVALPCTQYLLRDPTNQLTIASRRIESAQKLCGTLKNVTPMALDVTDQEALMTAVEQHDLVISLVPYIHHPNVIKAAIHHKKHVVTTSYVSPAMAELHADAERAGITVMNEIGVDPGVDHLFALKTIWEVHAQGGKLLHFKSYCGGLPAPECSNNPLGYKFSWSSRGVLLALRNEARFLEDGKKVTVQGSQLLKSAKPIWTGYPAFAFEGYANRDSTHYDMRYNIPEAQTIIRGTLRYAGYPEFMQAIVDIGFLDDSQKPYLAKDAPAITWRTVLAKVLGLTNTATDADLSTEIAVKSELVNKPEALQRVIAGMKWIGMFSDTCNVTLAGTPLDVLCAALNEKMQYGPGERDMVFLQHVFDIETADGKLKTITATLVEYGTENQLAMAKTVGIPCGLATQLILDGKISKRGVLAPMDQELVFPLIDGLCKEGIDMVEVEY